MRTKDVNRVTRKLPLVSGGRRAMVQAGIAKGALALQFPKELSRCYRSRVKEHFWNFLAAPVTGTLTGLLGTLLSAGLAVYLYRRGLPTSRLDYASNDVVVLNNKYSMMKDDIEIRFRSKPVPKVTTTILALWNSGNQTITKQQIIKADALRFQLGDEAEILQAHVIAATRPVIGAKVVKSADDRLALEFDFLDKGDGFAVFIAHSGEPSSGRVEGTVRGVKQGLRKQSGREMDRWWPILTPLLPMAIVAAVALLSHFLILEITSGLNYGLLVGSIVLMAFGPILWRKRRIRSFPADFRKNPALSVLLPHLADG